MLSRFVSRTASLSLVSVLAGVCLTAVLPSQLEAARGGPGGPGGGKMEVLPSQKAAPAAVFIDTVGSEAELRKQLRAKTGVTELGADAPHTRFSLAPVNRFGFATPQFLGLALVTQSPDVPLEREAPAANAFEIHKLADGSAMVVGFVGPELKPQLTPQVRPKNVRVALYSNPSDQAPHIVAVPLGKLSVDQMPRRLDPKNTNGPVVFEMDLQGTANRQSSQGAQ
ncbi:MAG: hypothetical protein ABL970_07870 [Nitrospira sp.]